MTVIDEFENEFKAFTGARHAVACCNGTAALHTALLALGIKRGDKVVTTPFSFVASANCILYCGATPIFADIDPETFCIAPGEVESKLDDQRIKAVVCVHIFGNVCDMKAITEICRNHKVYLVEDCAQALGARYGSRHVGNYGDFGTFSFYAPKNLWTFEGGMIVTNRDHLAKTARMIIDHGQSKKYVHEILGFNYRMPQICALIGLTQLKLHKKAVMSELGLHGPQEGHYPRVIYEQPFYRKLGIKGNCPNAEIAAKEVRERWLKR